MPSVSAPRTSRGYGSTCAYASACSASSPTWGPLPCATTTRCSWTTGAMACAARAMFRRWTSTVIGSERRSIALPPSAMTTVLTSGSECGHHHGLDRVETVLRLVEHDRAVRFEHVIGDLDGGKPVVAVDLSANLRGAVVKGRQAVHELHLRVAGPPDQVGVDLIRLQKLDSVMPQRLVLAHREPDVSRDEIDAAYAGIDIGIDGHGRAGLIGDLPGGRDELGVGLETFRRADADLHPQLASGDHQRVAGVEPGVPDVAEGDAVQRFLRVLAHREHIGQHLRRVELVAEPVVHRHAGKLAELFDHVLAKPTVFDRVEHSTQDARSVFDRLLLPDLRAVRSQVSHMCALVVRGHLKGAARASGRLLEDERDLLAFQPLLLAA